MAVVQRRLAMMVKQNAQRLEGSKMGWLGLQLNEAAGPARAALNARWVEADPLFRVARPTPYAGVFLPGSG